MDSYLLEVIAGVTLFICLWVLRTVHSMALDVRGLKTTIQHVPTKDQVNDMISEHAMLCAQQRVVNE